MISTTPQETPSREKSPQDVISAYAASTKELAEFRAEQRAQIQSRNWIIAGLIPVLLVLAIGLAASRQKAALPPPYVAVLDDRGKVLAIALTKAANGTQQDNLIRGELRHWIMDARTVYSDYDAQLEVMEDVEAQVDGGARALIEQWYDQNPPDERAKQATRFVRVTSMLKRSQDTYEAEWTEIPHATVEGGPQTEQRFKGIFRIHFVTPKESDISRNPTGFKIFAIDWGITQ